MRVENVTPKLNKNVQLACSKVECSNNFVEHNYADVDYSQIPFGAIYNVKPKKLLNIGQEQVKLLKQLSEYLQAEPKDFNIEDIVNRAFTEAMAILKAKTARKIALLEDVEKIRDNKFLTSKQKVDQLNIKLKELKQIDKMKIKPDKSVKKSDERMDYRLLNIFKNSIEEGEFGLAKLFNDYYQELNNIRTIKELNEKFPNIKVPQNPKEVIIKKITDTLTRDFYENIDNDLSKNPDKAVDNLYLNVKDKVVEIAKKLNVDPDEFCNKILDDTSIAVAEIFRKAKREGFSMLPENRKIKTPQITELDMKLFSVDFDDFVLSTVREHYLGAKKLTQIIYTDGKISIPISSLSGSEYKFEKMSEKLKTIVRSAEEIKRSQRYYELFDFDMLKQRLNLYSSSKLSDNEKLFERFVDFDTCGIEDREHLIRFLRVLDDISDGQKTVQDGVDFVYKENIYPKETYNLTEIERQKNAEKIKIEQQKVNELKSLKQRFDNCMNTLYAQNLTHIATICSKYRPKSLDAKDVESAKFIMDLVNDVSKKDVSRFEKSIMRWDAFNRYSAIETDSKTFKNALRFATDSEGNVNIDKAGQYLINSELVQLYPESKEFYKYPDILEKIMEKVNNDEELAIKYLMKFDKYDDLSDAEKSSILSILKQFDLKDLSDKYILKLITENKYIYTDYSAKMKISENSFEDQIATISAKAKQQIIQKYKFPICLEYFEAFEEALPLTASAKGSAGIKYIGRNNNKARYERELKIMGHDDRLYPSQNDYYFDTFSDKGIH